MVLFKVNHCEELKDSDPTISFIEKMYDLIQAMTAKSNANALHPDETTKSYKVRV